MDKDANYHITSIGGIITKVKGHTLVGPKEKKDKTEMHIYKKYKKKT